MIVLKSVSEGDKVKWDASMCEYIPLYSISIHRTDYHKNAHTQHTRLEHSKQNCNYVLYYVVRWVAAWLVWVANWQFMLKVN